MKQMAKVKFAKKNIKWEIKQKHAPTGSQNKSFLIPQPSSNFLSLTEQKSWQKCNISLCRYIYILSISRYIYLIQFALAAFELNIYRRFASQLRGEGKV